MIKKLLRTIQNYIPFLLEAKFSFTRFYRNTFKIPFEQDFNALSFFKSPVNALYIDVGGNRGQSTDAILMKKNNCIIHLFEPNPLLYGKLKLQYSTNDKIIIHSYGLGDKTGEFTLWIPWYKKWMYDGLASFDKQKAGNWLRNRVYFYNEKDLSLQEVKCFVKRLDDFNLIPFFIKLDIQGYELLALKGATETIKKYEPIILLESANDQISTFLNSYGYHEYAFKNSRFVRDTTGRLNSFYITDSKLPMIESKNL